MTLANKPQAKVYRKVAPTFWTGETGKAIRRRGSDAMLVAAYLMTSPHSNMLGLYYQPVLFMAHETGLGAEGAAEGLRHCIEAGFCEFDVDADVIWVIEMAKWQVEEQLAPTDNRCKGVQREYDGLTKSRFLGQFFDRYASAFHLSRRRDGTADDGENDLFGKAPPQAPPKPGTGTGTGTGTGAGAGGKDVGPAASPTAAPPDPAADASATPNSRGNRLRKDWTLPKAWGDWALAEFPQWSAEKVRLEGRKFADHWHAKTGKDATKADWLATWRNWCRSPIAHADDPKAPPKPGARAARNAGARRLLGFNDAPAVGQEIIDA